MCKKNLYLITQQGAYLLLLTKVDEKEKDRVEMAVASGILGQRPPYLQRITTAAGNEWLDFGSINKFLVWGDMSKEHRPTFLIKDSK